MCHKQLILHKAETFSVLHCHQCILIQCFDAELSGGHIGGRKKETFPVACGSMAVFVGRAKQAKMGESSDVASRRLASPLVRALCVHFCGFSAP